MGARQGGMMYVRYGRVCAVLFAASALGAPLAAQTATSCDSCAPAPPASRDELDRSRRALEAATKAFMKRRAEWYDRDSSKAAREALMQAERELTRAQRHYEVQQMEALRTEARSMEQRMRADMQRTQLMQRGDERGWLGIRLEAGGPGEPRDLPVIVSVDPGSPARRAGLEAGDVLVAVDGHSLRHGKLAFEHMLVPGTRIPLRIQRGNELKTLTVLVGRRPRSYGSLFQLGPDGDSIDVHMFDVPMPPMPPSSPLPSTAPMPPFPPLAATMPVGGIYLEGVATIAGAQLWDVDQLKDYFHVDDGLLVLRVLPGTPADRAGLRSGDVIVSTDGRSMTSIHALERALEREDDSNGSHAVRLAVVRKGKRLAMALRW